MAEWLPWRTVRRAFEDCGFDTAVDNAVTILRASRDHVWLGYLYIIDDEISRDRVEELARRAGVSDCVNQKL